MPGCPRSDIIPRNEVAVVHCWNRCVRRAWLCGKDAASGTDYEYRRNWIGTLQRTLASLFAIEIAFRAEMSNHLHVILRTRPDVVASWSDQDVVRRWLTITKLMKSRDGVPKPPNVARMAMERVIPGRVAKLRERLSDPSWFMAALSENISRRSNAEEKNWGQVLTCNLAHNTS